MYHDLSQQPLQQLDIVTREVMLPLLASDTHHATAYGIHADKLMDVLHRLMAHLETTQGHIQVLEYM
jgi:dynein heavy chain